MGNFSEKKTATGLRTVLLGALVFISGCASTAKTDQITPKGGAVLSKADYRGNIGGGFTLANHQTRISEPQKVYALYLMDREDRLQRAVKAYLAFKKEEALARKN